MLMLSLHFLLVENYNLIWYIEMQDKRICVGMELVTAVLGDHGQRPLQDYGAHASTSSSCLTITGSLLQFLKMNFQY